MNKYQESIEQYNKAFVIDPLNTQALNGKGDSLRWMKQFKESVEWYNEALAVNPQNILAFSGKGILIV